VSLTKAWVFGDNIDTDLIAPGKYLLCPLEELARHILEEVNPLFAQRVEKGDIVIAGKNFGCGSSREQAASGLKHLGIGAIFAESFARIFFRNCISIGLSALTSKEIPGSFQEGDRVEFSLREAYIKNLRTNQTYRAIPLPPQLLHIIEEGGILSMLKKKYARI